MGFGDSLKSFFLPSEEESARRRKDVFGTESKAVAGTVIVGTAAAAIAAPFVAGPAALRAIGTKVASLTLPQQIVAGSATAILAPIAAGAIVNDPKVLSRTAGGFVNTVGNLYELGSEATPEKAIDVVKENPLVSGILAAGALIGLGRGAGAVIGGGINALQGPPDITIENNLPEDDTKKEKNDTKKEKNDTKKEKNDTKKEKNDKSTAIIPDASPSGGGNPIVPSAIPLTPETQVIGKEVKSSSNRRKRKSATPQPTVRSPPVRINIVNQQAYIDRNN